VVARAAALVELGRVALPPLAEPLGRAARCVDTAEEARAIREAYADLPATSFSRAVLEPWVDRLAVSRLPAGVVWSDWGSPARVIAALKDAGLAPPWMASPGRAG
jgi:mannose-1-phosphate guanylyltransferase